MFVPTTTTKRIWHTTKPWQAGIQVPLHPLTIELFITITILFTLILVLNFLSVFQGRTLHSPFELAWGLGAMYPFRMSFIPMVHSEGWT